MELRAGRDSPVAITTLKRGGQKGVQKNLRLSFLPRTVPSLAISPIANEQVPTNYEPDTAAHTAACDSKSLAKQWAQQGIVALGFATR